MLTISDVQSLTRKIDDDKLGVKLNSTNRDKTRGLLVLYLQHTDVADRLDEVDPAWTFKILDEKWSGDSLFMRGCLTVKGVSRENVGEGRDAKGAASDCFKRCAMLFGVGRWLYDEELVWVPYNEQTDKYKRWTVAEFRAAAERSGYSQGYTPAAAPPLAQQARLTPSQPSAADVVNNPGSYVVKVGKKWKGMTLDQMGIKEAESFAAWIEADAASKGKPPSRDAAELCQAVSMYRVWIGQQAGGIAKAIATKPAEEQPPTWVTERAPMSEDDIPF
jgi:hypothetical protein